MALRRNEAQPGDLASVQHQMDRYLAKAQSLHGPEGRSNIFSDRLKTLAHTPLEHRLMDNPDMLAMAGVNKLPSDVDASRMPEAMMDKVSPFRTNANQRLADMNAFEEKMGSHNVMMPNEYIDNSVAYFVQHHAGWPRARIEFAVNRLLYYQTLLHEMGHCLGLRHDFGGSADSGEYDAPYYKIVQDIPLPDPTMYPNTAAGQQAYQSAYTQARSDRDLAGIDRYMDSSIMEYTANWYERVVTHAGRYDNAAISFGYGDMAEMYDNSATKHMSEINPTNTSRVWAKYYQGGESCTTDADCPYSTSGSHSAALMQANMDASVTQHCVNDPNGATLPKVCSNFDADVDAQAGVTTTIPIRLRGGRR